MMRAAVIMWAALGLAVAPAADAVTLTGAEGTPYQRWADASLVPTPNVTIEVHQEPCQRPAGKSACAVPGGIWIDMPGIARSDVRETFLHELGHHFDYSVMTDGARAKFLRLIGTPTRPWRDRPDSPHEQFAEAYQRCARSTKTRWYWVEQGYGYKVTWKRHRQICGMIRRLGNAQK